MAADSEGAGTPRTFAAVSTKAARAASLRRWAAALGVIAVACACMFYALTCARARSLETQGRSLFYGERPLHGRMTGHAQDLPGEVIRCGNCHERQDEKKSQSFGTVLGPDSLLRAVERRGGPAVRYTQPAFCRVLRDGVDPAHVMIAQTMPRYTLTDAQCEALWHFLTAK